MLLDVINELKLLCKSKIRFIVGGNGEINKLKVKIDSLGLKEIVEYVGWLDNREKIHYLNIADAFILPSYNEGLPISILEAMSYDLPVISTSVGGIPEVVINNYNGYLFQPEIKIELKNIIENIIKYPENLKRYNNSQDKVTKYYPESVKIKLNSLYNSVNIVS